MRLYRLPELTARRVVGSEALAYETITEAPPLDLSDRWPALHYSLCLEAPMPRHVAVAEGVEWDDKSLENALMGGDATPYPDGLTFARVLRPASVRMMAPRLSAISPEEMWERVDEGIDDYLPSDWPDPLKRSTVVAMFMRLVDVYRAAAAAGDGLLFHVAG